MWSKDTNGYQSNVSNSVGLTNLQENIVTWIEKDEYQYIYMSGYDML